MTLLLAIDTGNTQTVIGLYRRDVDSRGKITAADAIDFGMSGPSIRASGVPLDVRREEPYLKYNDIKPTDIEMLRAAVDERSGSVVRRSKEVLGRKAERRVVERVLDL